MNDQTLCTITDENPSCNNPTSASINSLTNSHDPIKVEAHIPAPLGLSVLDVTNEQLVSNEIQRMLWRMRWFFAFAMAFWTLAAILAPIVVFCITKNLYSFSFFSTLAPPIYLWHRFAKHLFPMDDKTFELKKMKIQSKMQQSLQMKLLHRK